MCHAELKENHILTTASPEIGNGKEAAVIIDKQATSDSLNRADFFDLLTISKENIITPIETIRTRPEECQREIKSNDGFDRRKRSQDGNTTMDLEVSIVVEKNLDMREQ